MPPTTRKQLATLIREARLARGIGVREAARLLNIDKSYYARIESGDVGLGKHAEAVARLYRLNVADIQAMAQEKLPRFRPYLRATTDLPDEALAELEEHFKAVTAKYKGAKR